MRRADKTDEQRRPLESAAFVYNAPPGFGGSGLLVRQILEALCLSAESVDAFGPPSAVEFPGADAVAWRPPPRIPSWVWRYSWLRWYQAQQVHLSSLLGGASAARKLDTVQPRLCYAFAELGLETLRWARERGVPSVLDSASAHLRHFRNVVQRESSQWCGGSSRTHPAAGMVDRVEREYELADRIRVASSFTRDTMVARGVAASKISIVPYALDLSAFGPPQSARPAAGPLRVCFVGMLALHKGFHYLLRALRRLGPAATTLRIVGGTVDRGTRALFERESHGLTIDRSSASSIRTVLHEAEILVLPSLHDGFGYVVAEAMASALPVIVTDHVGASDWMRGRECGWVVKAGDEEELAEALQKAVELRHVLPEMGRTAREAVIASAGTARGLSDWILGSS